MNKTRTITQFTLTTLLIFLSHSQVNASTTQQTESDVPSVEQLIQSGKDLFSSLQQDIESFITELKIPDFETIANDILSLNGSTISDELENKPSESYGIQNDIRNKAIVDSAHQVTQETTLSENAQQNLHNLAAATVSNVQINQQLGQTSQQLGKEAQNLDVSQHILQNLSQQSAINAQQSALNATQQGVIIQQNQQAQIDRAIGNILAAEQTQRLSEAATHKRRENAAASVNSTAALGLIRMPGVTPETANNPNSSALNPENLLSSGE